MLTNITQKTLSVFECIHCDFKCSNKNDYNRHILTRKHKMLTNVDTENVKNLSKFKCECGKEYNHRQSLSIHKKKCINENINEKKEFEYNITPELIIEIIKQNQELQKQNNELQKQMFEVIKNGTNNNTINNTNSHNKAFNLNFFLNETCKDAMNIMDFVESIQLQLSDLENVGKLGYVNGISNIIIKNLKELDMEKRPVHCTDKKRETMYVKDENKWEKDDGNKKICNAIKKVVSKNQRLIPKFKEAHPDCNTYHSKFSDQYNKLILESCGGSGDNDLEKEEKIIQNISKNVLVDK
jgi:hypothetical protein